jgi:hypothetical protein
VRNKLLALAAALSVFLLLGCLYLQSVPKTFPADNEILKILREKQPARFWKQIMAHSEEGILSSRLINGTIESFKRLSSKMNAEDSVSADAVLASVLFANDYLRQAETKAKRVINASSNQNEKRTALFLLARIYWRTKDKKGFSDIYEQLVKNGIVTNFEFEKAKKRFETIAVPQMKQMLLWLIIWSLLLFFPAVVVEVEQANWCRRFLHLDNRQGAYQAFRSSPLPGLLLSISAISFLVFNIPQRLMLGHSYGFLLAHVGIVWLMMQIPLYRLKKKVRGISQSISEFVVERIKLGQISYAPLTAIILTVFVLHFMVSNLAFWPLRRPFGIIFGMPAIMMAFYILIQLLLPYLLMLKPFKLEKVKGLSARLFKTEHNMGANFSGFIPFGGVSFLSTVVLWGNLENELDEREIRLGLKNAAVRFKKEQFFEDFLVLFILCLVGSFYVVFKPINTLQLFNVGPTFVQLIGIIFYILACRWIRYALNRMQIFESDSEMVKAGLQKPFVRILEKLNYINYLPYRFREGDSTVENIPALLDRKLSIMETQGEYFENPFPPDEKLLSALWRSRLSIDWKQGEDEAIYITSLEINLKDGDLAAKLEQLAEKNQLLGAECLLRKDEKELEVIFCCQKAAAKSSDPVLPAERVCEICSAAMLKSINDSSVEWHGTSVGCCLQGQDQEK